MAATRTIWGGVRAWATNSGPVLGIFLGLFLLWEVCCWLFKVPDFILPSPSVIIDKIVTSWWLLLTNGLVTAEEIVLGFGMSVVVGIPLACWWSIHAFSSASRFHSWSRCRPSPRSRWRRSW